MFKPTLVGYAHCDLPCGIYDPAQAKIEAQSVKASIEDPRIVVVYALVPEKASSVGYGFIKIKGANKLRDLLSTHGGYVTELVIKCRTPGEALYLLDQFGEKNILQ